VKLVEVVRTYLEHDTGAPAVAAPPRDGLILEPVSPCPAELYLWLYRETGRALHWIDRLAWDAGRAAAYLVEPGRQIWLLRDGAMPIGWFELGPAPDGAVEIVYFGLLPWALGTMPGLGRWLLQAAIAAAYQTGATRIIVNTCTLDHPAALPNYLARGFRPVREERYQMPLPAVPS
jgi:GNAT superfamily N-acetyltransferase